MMQGSLAEKLRVLRARMGLSLTEAAARAGVTRDTLSDIEHGKRHPYMPTLSKIAAGYDVPVEELLEKPVPLDEASETGPKVVTGAAHLSGAGKLLASGEVIKKIRQIADELDAGKDPVEAAQELEEQGRKLRNLAA